MPNINVYYPALVRGYEMEGEVTIKFLLDEHCSIKGIIPVKTLGEDFEKPVIDAYHALLDLSKK